MDFINILNKKVQLIILLRTLKEAPIVLCTAARSLWVLFSKYFWFKLGTVKKSKRNFVIWSSVGVDESIRSTWKMIPQCIIRSIWKERNQSCFEGRSTTIYTLKARCLRYLYCLELPFCCKQFVRSLRLCKLHEQLGFPLIRRFCLFCSQLYPLDD